MTSRPAALARCSAPPLGSGDPRPAQVLPTASGEDDAGAQVPSRRGRTMPVARVDGAASLPSGHPVPIEGVPVADLAVRLARAERAVVLIDGGSGSGKTTFARALASTWPGEAQLVSMDAFYPGWEGLAEGGDIVVRNVLRPWRPGYRRWDWTAGARADWVRVDPVLPIIIEGCGALTPAARALATAGIWCELPAEQRKRRALERDGEVFAPHWEEWAAQEAAHWRRHRPWDLADLIVLSASTDRVRLARSRAGRHNESGLAEPRPP